MFVNYTRTNDKTCGMEMKSQNTMNTSIPSPSSDGILLIPTWVSVSVLVVSVLLLIGNCTGCSLLLKFLLKSSKLERTPSHTFILYATLVSMLASVIGMKSFIHVRQKLNKHWLLSFQYSISWCHIFAVQV